MEYNLGSNRASNFKSAERAARGRFEVTSTITPELYDTKSYYQLIYLNNKMHETLFKEYLLQFIAIFIQFIDNFVHLCSLCSCSCSWETCLHFFLGFDWLALAR